MKSEVRFFCQKMENDNSLINRSTAKCRPRQPKAKGHQQQAGTDAAEGVIKEYEDFTFLQQDHIFKREGRKGRKTTAESRDQQSAPFLVQPRDR